MEEPDRDDARGRPGMDQPVLPIGPGGGGRAIVLPLLLIAVAVAIAFVEPWGLAPPATPSGAPPAPSAASPPGSGPAPPAPSPSPSPSPIDPYAELVVTCGYPSGWRASTLQHWIGRGSPIRTWTAVDPITVAGPLDPALSFAPVATDLVLAIGYCSPVTSERPPRNATSEIWALRAGGAERVLAHRLEPPDVNALGGLWLPTPGLTITVDGRTGWAPGRYAIRIMSASFDRWLGIEIEDISGLRSPAGTPAVGSPAAISSAFALP